MNLNTEQRIFRRGSTTYYFSARFFPKDVRDDVLRLYSFVRVADDYVDTMPPAAREYKALKGLWQEAAEDDKYDVRQAYDDTLNQRVVKNMLGLVRRYDFDLEWVEAFFESMDADLAGREYASIDGTLWYVYGSAEVVGLMMASIMGLPQAAQPFARSQGRAMQYINFIRDIDEDNRLGRCYFPAEDLRLAGLSDLSRQSARDNPEGFRMFMERQLDRYASWQAEAEEGFAYIPRRLQVPLRTAVNMYDWTAQEIRHNPFIVYEKKVRPDKRQVLRAGLLNIGRSVRG
jgi:15-cis-phytoene synthase